MLCEGRISNLFEGGANKNIITIIIIMYDSVPIVKVLNKSMINMPKDRLHINSPPCYFIYVFFIQFYILDFILKHFSYHIHNYFQYLN